MPSEGECDAGVLFRDAVRLRQFRQCPVGKHLDGFAHWLRAAGYKRRPGQLLLRGAAHLWHWAACVRTDRINAGARCVSSSSPHLCLRTPVSGKGSLPPGRGTALHHAFATRHGAGHPHPRPSPCRAWHDGTRAILEPHELIERLAALVPKPRINLLLYHGVLGPSARLRSSAVTCARALPPPRATPEISPPEDQAPPQGPPARRDRPRTATATRYEERRGAARLRDVVSRLGGQSLGPGSSRSEPRRYTSWAKATIVPAEAGALALAPGGAERGREPSGGRGRPTPGGVHGSAPRPDGPDDFV